jgi:hypothetical protein
MDGISSKGSSGGAALRKGMSLSDNHLREFREAPLLLPWYRGIWSWMKH